jgi:hypothetical protein
MQLLRPGILVSLKTELSGGALYERVDLEHTEDETGRDKAKWETTRYIEDPAEYERAVKVRSKAGGLVRRACAQTAFGLLCPESRESSLDEAIAEAQRIVSEFNASARHSQVRVYVLRGRIASSDEEAARAIASEVRDLLDQMERGVRAVNAEAVREAATRAKKIAGVLDEAQAKKIGEAVEAAREAATAIVKRVVKGGEEAAQVIEELKNQTAAIETARFAFLDTEEVVPTRAGEELPQVSVPRFTELDVEEAS